LKAEKIVQKFKAKTGNPAYIYRLPRVFGKWCKPNYNSVVATFCYKTIHNLPVQVIDPSFELDLVHIDDVIEEFIKVIGGDLDDKKLLSIQPEYTITISKLAEQIKFFKESGERLAIEGVNDELVSKLYSTYISYIP
jgi:UDP-2-acetamido-2,6-beta-L-arabino-hexul-4-ose reductase